MTAPARRGGGGKAKRVRRRGCKGQVGGREYRSDGHETYICGQPLLDQRLKLGCRPSASLLRLASVTPATSVLFYWAAHVRPWSLWRLLTSARLGPEQVAVNGSCEVWAYMASHRRTLPMYFCCCSRVKDRGALSGGCQFIGAGFERGD